MSDKYIQILDYGIGNIRSLQNSLNFLGINNKVKKNIDHDDKNFNGLIIPGVGAFPSAMKILEKNFLIDQIKTVSKKKFKVLGICLGMQILFSKSEEIEITNGLNLIEGSVEILNKDYNCKIPNIGWRELKKKDDNFFENSNKKKFYFVHSYVVKPKNKNLIKFIIDYEGIEIPAIVNYENIYGFQFHPEKSGPMGLNLLKEFCEI
jgi:glutamine amidotransferase